MTPKKIQQRVRVNLRLPPDLVKWAKKYAKVQGVSFTEIVERALDHMQESANGR